MCASFEKGSFFEGDIETEDDFDITKLKIRIDGEISIDEYYFGDIVSGVYYDDIVENLPEKRSKNRRVDIVINLKPLPKIEIPGFYNSIQKNHIVGDHIYLDNILFDRGSSKLTFKAKTELDKVAKLLHKYKNLQFEIQGHVCCTPPYQKEAIDKETRKRALSTNRAESVFKYLAFKKIPKNRMTFKGYGNTVPLGKGAEYDRRVELVITKI
jgi:outer membrane protein OmpA-like peptidoglycan-associated protein